MCRNVKNCGLTPKREYKMGNAFSWDAIAGGLQDNAFGNKKSYSNDVDTRFWKLSRDENDNGGALVRFLVDPSMVPFIHMEEINASKGGKNYFVSEYSPTSIGLKSPFEEKFSELWNWGTKDKDDKGNWLCPMKGVARTLGRKESFITNIKVIKDPSNPDNEGKIFLYKMTPTIFEKVKNAMKPSETEIALGEEPMAIFDPLEGNNFLVKAKKGSNNFITYEDSKFDEKITAAYKTEDEALADIKANAHELGDFLKPEFFKTYDELNEMLTKFLSTDSRYIEVFGEDAKTGAAAEITDAEVDAVVANIAPEPVVEAKPEKKASKVAPDTSEIDDLLAEFE